FANEHQKFRGGDRVATFQWDGAVIAPLICYDLRFPEVFRIATRAGTEIFVVIANWPTARVHHWTTLLAARAIENQAYAIGCNRCGADPNVAYPGRSVVFDPRGQLIGDAGGAEGVLRVDIDVESLRQYRREFPALNDMRFVGEKLR
ncbi:MAG: carbon-nitrogen family hydrolase, partial [Burkholderiales bacterium]|nr:carbon-nitrogen family hydrolase [Phycisphaerae bacterium]